MLKSCSWSLFALRCVLTVEQRTPAGQASPMECFSVLTAQGPTGPLAFTWVSFGKYLVSFDSKSHLLIVLFVHIPAQRGKPILPSASDWNLLSVCFAFAVSDSFLGIVFNLPAVLPELCSLWWHLSSALPSQTIQWFWYLGSAQADSWCSKSAPWSCPIPGECPSCCLRAFWGLINNYRLQNKEGRGETLGKKPETEWF